MSSPLNQAPTVRGFRIGLPLGRGGFGDVYSAVRERDGRQCALKILHRLDADTIRELKHEARTLWSLQVEGVVTPLELGSDAERWYVALPLVRGRTLDEAVSDVPETSRADWVRRVLDQVSRIVRRLHRSGVLHLDIKPRNVIWSDAERATLLDFGFARWTGAAPPGGLVLEQKAGGTLVYMAPELLLGDAPTPKSDWYSVGVMGWELLYGKAPIGTSRSAPIPMEGDEELHRLCKGLLHRSPGGRWGESEVSEFFGWEDDVAESNRNFVGRTDEVAHILEALDGEGTSAIAIIRGSAGIGKSSVLRELKVALETRGHHVLLGRCYEQDRSPYRGFEGVLHFVAWRRPQLSPDHVEALALMFPEEGHGVDAPAPEATEVRAAFAQAFASASLGVEPILIIDDLQWIDDDGLALLLALLDDPDSRVKVVAAAREERGHELASLLEERGHMPTVCDLGPLPGEQAVQLIESLAPAISREQAIGLLQQAKGNTYMLTLLARLGLSGLGGSVSLAEIVGEQLRDLNDADRMVIEMLAVASRPLEEAALARACWLAGVGDPGFERLKLRSWLATQPGPSTRVGVYHDLLSQTVAVGVAPQRALALHSNLKAALTDCGAGPAELYAHADALGMADEASRLAEAAGYESVRRAAFDAAARWFESALSSKSGGHARRVKLLRALALSLRGSGRPLAAADRLREAGAGAVEVAGVLLEGGSVHEGRRLLDEALADSKLPRARSTLRTAPSLAWGLMTPLPVRVTKPDPRLGNDSRLAWVLGRGLAYTHPFESLDYAIRALRAARRGGETSVEASALAFIGGGVFANLSPLRARGERYLQEAVELARDHQDDQLEAAVQVWSGIRRLNQGHWEEAESDLLAALEALAAAPDRHWDRLTASQAVLWLDWKAGRFASLAHRARRPFQDASARGDQLSRAILGQYVAFAEIAAGRLGPARAISGWLRDQWVPDSFTVQQFYASLIECLCALREQDVQAAHGHWARVQSAFRKAGGERVEVSFVDNCELEIALALQGCPLAPRRLRKLQSRLRSVNRPDAELVARWSEICVRDSSAEEVGALGHAFVDAGRLSFGHALCLQACEVSPRVGDSATHVRALDELGVVKPLEWARASYPAFANGRSLAPK